MPGWSCRAPSEIYTPRMKTELLAWARTLKRQTLTVYFAARDPRMPWIPRVVALGVAAYALSPIDLIPDFIPVLGLLDDLLIVPLGIALVIRLTPRSVLDDVRRAADAAVERPASRVAAAFIVLLWVLSVLLLTWVVFA